MVKVSNSFRIGNFGLSVSFVAGNMNVITSGVSSRIVGTNLHCVFLDFDKSSSDDILEEELKWLQQIHTLGNFIVLKTSEVGRHAICLDVLQASEAFKVIMSSTCDEMFKTAPTMNPKRSWVLRCGKKGNRGAPTYAYTIQSRNEGSNLQSRGHANYLRTFGVNVKLKRPFGPNQVEIQTYYTTKKNV
jgi:hypothetical protein